MGMVSFLKSRGWKRYLSSWWFKPLPGWKGISPNQVVYGLATAFRMEQFRMVDEDGDIEPICFAESVDFNIPPSGAA